MPRASFAASVARPFRIYRPGFVVGDSKTGYIDKIDGPYYFFKALQKMRQALPPWMPMIGIEGGRINIVPVDFVADALDYLAHKKGLDGKCFHLTDPAPHRIGEVLNIFARAGHAPQMTMRVNARMFGFIPAPILYGLGSLAPVKRMMKVGADRSRHSAGTCSSSSTGRRATTTARRRRRSRARASRVPYLESYAAKLWDYWERNLDPDLFIDRTLVGPRQGQGRRRDGLVVGHRQGDGAEARRGGREGDPRRARRGEAHGDQAGDRRSWAARRGHVHGRHLGPRLLRRAGRARAEGARRVRLSHQQRRPLDPSRRHQFVRPLPRFRADDAAQLFRLAAADHRLPAQDDRAEARPHHQHLVDRRAVERAALLGLRRVEVGARLVLARAPRRSSSTRGSTSRRSTCRWCARR